MNNVNYGSWSAVNWDEAIDAAYNDVAQNPPPPPPSMLQGVGSVIRTGFQRISSLFGRVSEGVDGVNNLVQRVGDGGRAIGRIVNNMRRVGSAFGPPPNPITGNYVAVGEEDYALEEPNPQGIGPDYQDIGDVPGLGDQNQETTRTTLNVEDQVERIVRGLELMARISEILANFTELARTHYVTTGVVSIVALRTVRNVAPPVVRGVASLAVYTIPQLCNIAIIASLFFVIHTSNVERVARIETHLVATAVPQQEQNIDQNEDFVPQIEDVD